MGTPRFNKNIIECSRLLSDERTDATAAGDTGKTYKSVVLSGYQNRAIRQLIRETYYPDGINPNPLKMQTDLPEYVREATGTLSSGGLGKAEDVWQVMEMVTVGGVVFHKLVSDILRIKVGADRNRVPSANNPYFYEEGRGVRTLGVTSGDVLMRVIMQHQDIAPANTGDVADLTIADIHDVYIVRKMLEFAMADTTLVSPT